MNAHDRIHDVIGVGFGPSNLALAIALDEIARRDQPGLSFHFVERQPRLTWHGGMLLPGSDMQISFLKDLVSLRDPTSPFTFVNYLHEKGRLEAFINRKTFFPSRVEFNDYLRWAASRFDSHCSYGEEVVAIEPHVAHGLVVALDVRSRSAAGGERVRRARNIVIAAGGTPSVPDCFVPFAADARILHSSGYLDGIAGLGLADRPASRVAVIGGGQSAAEILMDLHGRFSRLRADLVLRARALKPADDSPFVNEIFSPAGTDIFFRQSQEARRAFLDEFRNTNYAVVDLDLIQRVYDVLYEQRVEGERRLTVLSGCEVLEAAADAEGIALTLRDRQGGPPERRAYDAVILATGYRRDPDPRFLQHLGPYLRGLSVDRHYRLRTTDDCEPAIFLQGLSETTHGLSDSLLSVIAVRAREIAEALVGLRARPSSPVLPGRFARAMRVAASS
ncbi:lysine N(6)-hydroxylase/L-ornithine N(5)-oxygenase family protein [Chelatococcus sp. SYSU_G07232]|uniref:Lysine N(6)-hydroxylase/L-ornithine N(5)-oxygenase family protein n=1 Tax=Chelatococcus albus TaxID=3047466 RepID=A0ABT7ABC4_9HYPH|nr:lysine N(6)-hydroxylase/L-ornithine N(5)-oxygenase family protein [Chelatococcus sp. SYSU_G07232]MDJ1156674.1 lysine N(6)-hydroxylase/L-ornithine N(5)-oxygenase family protein [Chelatococcus sp. SYSU_G07232]